jgi:hypothetical protein
METKRRISYLRLRFRVRLRLAMELCGDITLAPGDLFARGFPPEAFLWVYISTLNRWEQTNSIAAIFSNAICCKGPRIAFSWAWP